MEAPTNISMGFYLLMWGIFTGLMFIGTLKINIYLQIVFALLAILFLLLAISDFTMNSGIKFIAGLEGIVCGASAVYTALHQVLCELYCKKD
jgi:succinate-acetate transporter protein